MKWEIRVPGAAVNHRGGHRHRPLPVDDGLSPLRRWWELLAAADIELTQKVPTANQIDVVACQAGCCVRPRSRWPRFWDLARRPARYWLLMHAFPVGPLKPSH